MTAGGGGCLDDGMTDPDIVRVVQASRFIAAPADVIFEHIADPAKQPAWDGNDNLAEAAPGQRVVEAPELQDAAGLKFDAPLGCVAPGDDRRE